jgi:hypothetical protein
VEVPDEGSTLSKADTRLKYGYYRGKKLTLAYSMIDCNHTEPLSVTDMRWEK